MHNTSNKINNIDKIFDLYKKYGNKGYIGEEISQLEHATQTAILAEKENYHIEVVLAAFFHDIGHLLIYDNNNIETMGEYGVMNHEIVGAEYLKDLGFEDILCNLVKNHILTKRYLITKDPNYYNNLSNASKNTFEYQGGLLTNNEIIEFENDPLFKIHLKLREWDDYAKDTSQQMKDIIIKKEPINYYYNMTKKYILNY